MGEVVFLAFVIFIGGTIGLLVNKSKFIGELIGDDLNLIAVFLSLFKIWKSPFDITSIPIINFSLLGANVEKFIPATIRL